MINRKMSFSTQRLMQAKSESKGNSGSPVQSILDLSKYEGKELPKWYSPKEGTNHINIIPYEVTTNLHPGVANGTIQLGTDNAVDFVYLVDVHRFIGPLKANVLCPKQFGQPCPICELNQALFKQGDKEGAKALRSTQRVFYNVEDLSEPGKIKLFETSNYLFHTELLEEATANATFDGSSEDFVSPDTGKSVEFRGSKEVTMNMEFLKFKSFKFHPRNPISDQLLASAVPFDKYAKLFSYEELSEIMSGKIPASIAGAEVVQPIAEPVQIAQPVQQAYVPPVQPAQAVTPMQNLAAQALQQPVQQVPVQQPVQTPIQQPVAQAPVQAATQAPAGLICPFKHTPGVDTDKTPDCDNCQLWEPCADLIKR